MNIPNHNPNTLPFQAGDWVKVIKKPKNAVILKKGDIVRADQVSPQRQMIRISDPDVVWEYLHFDEIAPCPPPPEPVGTGTTDLSVRERQGYQTPQAKKALTEIKAILASLDVSVRDDIIEKLVSSRDDTIDNERLSELQEHPKIIWRSPAKREAKYPWFECGKLRAYIGGGDRNSPIAQKRVALVQYWIIKNIPPVEIIRRIKAKEFHFNEDGTDLTG